MWQAGEIVQGDSGLVVSNKLDAEFARIQQEETRFNASFAALEYTDTSSIVNKSEDSKIVSPYTLWYVLDPELARISDLEEFGQYLSRMSFDGEFWIRTGVLFEYTGTYKPYDELSSGYFITKEHLEAQKANILEPAIKTDGSNDMDVGYIPANEQSVSTKGYVDDIFNQVNSRPKAGYVEYPASEQGDVKFNAPLAGIAFAVYKNGILQRRNKYVYDDLSFTFNSPLDDGDEITLTILGER